MSRYRFPAFITSSTERFLVLEDMQHTLIEYQRLEPGAELRKAMDAFLARLGRDGWIAESAASYGFTFVCREGVRRLLSITERSPFDTREHAFNPFRDA